MPVKLINQSIKKNKKTKKTGKWEYKKRFNVVFGQEPKNKARRRKFMFIKANRAFREFYFSIYRNRWQVYKNRLKTLFKKASTTLRFYKLLYSVKRTAKFFNIQNRKSIKNQPRSLAFITAAELTLETGLIRSGLIKKRSIARWLIKNGFVFLNKKRVVNPTCRLRVFDTLKIDGILWYNFAKRFKPIYTGDYGYEVHWKTGAAVLYRLPSATLISRLRFFKMRIFKPFLNSL